MNFILFVLVALIVLAFTALWLVFGYIIYTSVKDDYVSKKLGYLIASSSFFTIYIAGSLIGLLSLIMFNTNWLGDLTWVK